ncbi:MAG TPA: protein-glutamate O-methyltransferase CheR [Syntrophomonadaceae bacterium]|nr:protein-glutamate O-methyltransferase CheR [Syntrophomonadaceae bacterium]
MSNEEYTLLTDFIRNKTGLSYDDKKRYYVEKRICDRMRATKLESFRRYFQYLQGDLSGRELQILLNRLTVNETYFFREYEQLKCFAEEALPEIIANAGMGPLRVWSAGCSTGEEAYTLAIILLEMLGEDGADFEVHATDINSEVLLKARLGVYDERSVRDVPEVYLNRYFTRTGGRYGVDACLKEKVRFYQVNLKDRQQMSGMRDFHAIFCRNVLIYFDDMGRREVALYFYESLLPKGFIFLGHSESMSRISPVFRVRKFNNAIIYQK